MSQAFVDKCKRFFEEANTDGRPGLTIGELRLYVRQVLPNLQMTDQEFAEMFMDIDDDSDKIISFDEFSDVFLKKDPKQVKVATVEGVFDQFDKDGSGCLSPDEIKAVFKTAGISMSDDELDGVLSSVDSNSDGKINKNEFVKMWSEGL